MEHLKMMKDKLVDTIEKEINGNLTYASADELGKAVDMVKDLSEAIYYCTITDAMEDKSKEGSHYPVSHYYDERTMPKYSSEPYYLPPMYDNYPIMYNDGGSGSSRYMGDMRYNDGRGGQGSTMYHQGYDYPRYPAMPMMAGYDDRSQMSKRRYMEGKPYNDKAMQMKELECYTQELTSELTDMIKDASPEERQLLQQKIAMLAQKIK